uniref:Uncharacterized protein n=1 Tax=Rhizophora mucronata TaxID=61149 RepID=A0A2P2Q6V2_RHIMU
MLKSLMNERKTKVAILSQQLFELMLSYSSRCNLYLQV